MQKNNFFKSLKEKFLGLGKKGKRLLFVAVIVIIIMLAIFFSALFPKSKNNAQSNQNAFSVTDYAAGIEKKLEQILLATSSVTKVSVFVVVDSTPKVEYLTDTEQTSSTNSTGNTTTTSSETAVFEKNGSVSTPVVVKTTMPSVLGVLIVTNKISASTKYNIINSVSVVLNIDSGRISILQEG